VYGHETFIVRTLCVFVFLATRVPAQEVLPLYPGTPPGSTQENYPEKEYFSKTWHTEVVTNVTKPTLTVFKPSPELRNGTAVVICPGGGFMALSITSEGIDVAKYLAERGVTAFVLKYRIGHTGEYAPQEFTDDQLGRAPESVALYEKWTGAHKSAELHMYATGGHGFGMQKQSLPTDDWIERLADRLQLQGWLK
jgi:hypothetical protein